MLKRVVMRGNIDPVQQRITLEQGDLGTKDRGGGGGDGVTVAMSGKFDYGGEPRLALGIACNPMSAAAFKRLWPAFICHRRFAIGWSSTSSAATSNASTSRPMPRLPQMQPCGPPMPEEGLSVEIVGSVDDAAPGGGTAVDPRCRHDASVERPHREDHARQGHRRGFAGTAADHLQRLFEVPNTRMKMPPARVSFRVDGPVPAAAELLALDRLREYSGAPFDPAGTKGTVGGPGHARHAAASRSAAGLDRLRHHRRSFEFQRRQDAVRPEGRGADAAGLGAPTSSTRSRATSRSRARRPRSSTASSRAKPRPRSSCRRRSMKRRGHALASMSARRSPDRCR